MNPETPTTQTGFTLVELIVVMAILAVLVAVVSIRWQSAGEHTAPNQADLLAGNIRHIQTMATTQGKTLRLNIYLDHYCATVSPDTDCAKAIVDPATSTPLTVFLADAVTLTGISTDFDSFGRPKDSAGLLSTPRTFTLKADTTTWSITLSPITGFVAVTTP